MNEQILQELRLYIQKHMGMMTVSDKFDESHYDRMAEEAPLPQFFKIKRQKEVSEEPEQQYESYQKSIAPPTQDEIKRIAYSISSGIDLEEYIRRAKNEETFSTKLLKYIDQTGLSDAEVYKRAGIDRRHFSKIRCDKNYKPKKATAIALCLALELKLEQTEEVLGLAGYSLSNNDTGDLIVKFCIEKRKFNLMDVNEALVYFGEKAIGVVG